MCTIITCTQFTLQKKNSKRGLQFPNFQKLESKVMRKIKLQLVLVSGMTWDRLVQVWPGVLGTTFP